MMWVAMARVALPMPRSYVSAEELKVMTRFDTTSVDGAIFDRILVMRSREIE